MAAKIELGSCKLLRSNTNYLYQSLEIYGEKDTNELAWTDGERLWLLPVDFHSSCNLETTCINAKEPCLAGEFGGFVFGVSCSAVTNDSCGYYIAVALKEKVVFLFRKLGEAVVKIVKEYLIECVPQGCEWHPRLPLLAVLSKTSAVLLCFSDELECTVIPIQTSNRNLQTSAWSSDGTRLAVAVENSLCIFSWADFSEPNHFSFVQWNSLELTGKITCIVPWQMSSFIVATECPLDKLCGNSESDGDLFEVGNISYTYQNGSDSCGESRGKKSDSEDTDFTILTQRTDQDSTSLLKLKLRRQQFEVPEALAQVIAICCKGVKPREICRMSIQGLISPDLLLFQPLINTVVVGSHFCSKLHCYSLHTSNLNGKTEFKAKDKTIELDPNTKPKGICLIPGLADNCLCLLGKSKELSYLAAFPPAANTEHYDVSLRCFNLVLSGNNVGKSESSIDQLENDNQCSNQASGISPSLRLPDGSVFKGFIKAVETEKSCLISELGFTGDEELNSNSKEVMQGDHRSCFLHIQEVKTAMMTRLSEITEKLSKVEKGTNEMISKKDEKKKHMSYPLPDYAEFVCVVWTDELTGAVEQENFLLDNGRLKLKTVKQAFNASLVRICVGDVPCIVSSGENGFIPMRFISGSTVQMSGHSKHQCKCESPA